MISGFHSTETASFGDRQGSGTEAIHIGYDVYYRWLPEITVLNPKMRVRVPGNGRQKEPWLMQVRGREKIKYPYGNRGRGRVHKN